MKLADTFNPDRHHHFKTLDSTNSHARKLAEQGAAEGTIITADEQILGRGQRQNTWLSPAGKGLFYSQIFRPAVSADKILSLTLMAGIAVCEAIRATCDLEPGLKWPNDVLINDKKVSGILTESSWSGDQLSYVVIGIGINTDWSRDEFPDDVIYPATSLNLETDQPPSLLDLTKALAESLDRWYETLKSGDTRELFDQWEARSTMLSKEITVDGKNRSVTGTAIGLDKDGFLVVKTKEGTLETCHSGSVRFNLPERQSD